VDPAAASHDNRRRHLQELVVDVYPNPAVVVDLDGVVVLINGQARATFGLSQGDVGRPFRDLEMSYRPMELRSVIERVQTERRPLRINAVPLTRAADDVDYHDVLIQPLTGDDGTLLGTVVMFIDTTHAVHLLDELKRTREDLETTSEELQSTNEGCGQPARAGNRVLRGLLPPERPCPRGCGSADRGTVRRGLRFPPYPVRSASGA